MKIACETSQGESSPQGLGIESDRHLSPKMDDSGIGQAFFPPDFDSEAVVSTPLPPRLLSSEHGGAIIRPLSPGDSKLEEGGI